MNGAALFGLQAFVRRILESVVQLRDMPEEPLHLKSEATAAKHGWPNSRVANIAIMFVWAMFREDRWSTGLPFVPLEALRILKLDPRVAIDPRLPAMSIEEFVKLHADAGLPARRSRSKVHIWKYDGERRTAGPSCPRDTLYNVR